MSTKRSAAKCLTDLPSELLVGILARLPLRTLFVTRSVCKAFLFLTTRNPQFIDLHSSNAAQSLVFQFGISRNPSYLLRLAEPELDYFAPQNSHLKPLFQLPITEDPAGENRFFLANSCNGLVYFFNRFASDDRSLVCNPVTNEYVLIPEVGLKIRSQLVTKSMWLGFSPAINQYKVVSIFYWDNTIIDEGPHGFRVEVLVKAQVFVIGSDLWRDIDDTPPRRQLSWDLCSTLVNGLIYWFDRFWTDIVSFDFETEKFGEVPLPAEEQITNKQFRSIGVLGGCLCLCSNDFFAHRFHLWVMRKCGNQDSWRKEFVVDMLSPKVGYIYGMLKPLQFLQNGEILMLWMGNDLVCYDPRTETLRYFGLHKLRLAHKAVALTPSFVPLKDALKVENVLTQYVRPRDDEKEL